MNARIGVSPLTGRVFRGRVNKAGNAFVGEKKDITSDVLRAVIEKAEFHGGTFEIEGNGQKWTVTVTRSTEGDTMTLPPLPEPDTHCWDDDTGRDVWSHSTAQLIAYAEQAVAAQVDRLRDENKRLWADAERYRWLRKNTIVLGIFHYQIDDELEELVDGRIAAARAALKEPT